MQIRDFLFGLGLGAVPWLFRRFRPNSRALTLDPDHAKVWRSLYQQYARENGPVLAAVGGGTGLSTLLRGLKNYTSNLTAIVNVTDDGGSSGRLRENLDMLPPGDIRNCLLALANTEPLLEKVFQYRFTAGEDLAGHNLGNLFLAALTEEFGFEEAVVAASRVLAVSGEVLPVTLDKLSLVAHLTDGRIIRGESRIPEAGGRIRHLSLEPATSSIYPAARQAILDAEVVVVGPGSLYTSVLANLLVPGVAQALRESPARKLYICNVMTQPGETDGYSAADHLQAIHEHVGKELFDMVVINANMEIPGALLAKYAEEGAVPVRPDVSRMRKMGVSVLAANLVSPTELVRHDQEKLARIILAEVLANQKNKVNAGKANRRLNRNKRGVQHDVRAAGKE